MSRAHQHEAAERRSPPNEYPSGGENGKSSQRPEKAAPNRFTLNHEGGVRHLPTRMDVVDAARWRLRSWSSEVIQDATERAAALRENNIADDEPATVDVLGLIDDGLDSWAGLCALLVLAADECGDVGLLFRAGAGLMMWRRQVQSACGGRKGDALSELIDAYLRDFPGISIPELWGEFIRRASYGSLHDVLEEFDEGKGLLWYSPRKGGDATDIDFSAFRKRVERRKKSLGHEPANVPPTPVASAA